MHRTCLMTLTTARTRTTNGDMNRLLPSDRAVHDWYRFVLSFPPHLVRDYLGQFGVSPGQRVLDPFCGTGTTLVEAKKHGIESIGIEANLMAHFAASVKVDWRPDPDGLLAHARTIAQIAYRELESQGIEDESLSTNGNGRRATLPLRALGEHRRELLLTDSMSPVPLHKALLVLDCLDRMREERYHDHLRLALARSIVQYSSNLQFGPEVGVGPAKTDAAVIGPWLSCVGAIAEDLRRVATACRDCRSEVHLADAREMASLVEPCSIDAVITSPPYPNEKDYTRTTRLESVLLGFLNDKQELRAMKQGLIRSNTRNVFKADDDDQFVAGHLEIRRIAEEIEARRVELQKTSGFERQYARVTRLYFGGMHRHLATLRPLLRPGARLAYVVGDQASYLRVMIRTGQLLGGIARDLGYEVEGIDLFRTRLATATREQLREEVVRLRWTGGGGGRE